MLPTHSLVVYHQCFGFLPKRSPACGPESLGQWPVSHTAQSERSLARSSLLPSKHSSSLHLTGGLHPTAEAPRCNTRHWTGLPWTLGLSVRVRSWRATGPPASDGDNGSSSRVCGRRGTGMCARGNGVEDKRGAVDAFTHVAGASIHQSSTTFQESR